METSPASPDETPAVSSTRPSLKQRWLKRLKRLGWVAVWLATGISLFYAIENWRGRRAWNAYVEKVKARGDSVEPDAVIPPPIPDAENFALSPIFQEVFRSRYESDASRKSSPQASQTRVERDLRRIRFQPQKKVPELEAWQHGAFADLGAWQAFLESGSEAPSLVAQPTPAENVLLLLAEYDSYLRQLHETKERPYSRFPIRYEDAPNIIAPHYGLLNNLSYLVSLRPTARLAAGNREGAFEDLLLAFRLTNSTSSDPLLIAALVRRASLNRILQPIWEGMVKQEWTDQQLATIEQRLSTVNLVKHFQEGMRADRNLFFIPALDAFRKNPKEFWEEQGAKFLILPSFRKLLGDWYSDPGVETSLDNAIPFILKLAPSGWYDQNKVSAGNLIDRIIASVDPVAKRVDVDRLQVLMEEFDRKDRAPRSPYEFLQVGPYSHVFIRLAHAQGIVGLARTAVALERHRLRHGDLPESLSALGQDLLPSGGVPQDPASGKAPHYRRISNARFTLYYEGWNGVDDGGIQGTKSNGSGEPMLDPTTGDWVWPMPASSADEAK